MNEFQIANHKEVYRIKKMNAIEILAMRSQINTDNAEQAIKFYNSILERIEVQIGDSWLPVRSIDHGFEVYMPNGIENDVNALDELIHYFVHEYMLPIFTNSDESNN